MAGMWQAFTQLLHFCNSFLNQLCCVSLFRSCDDIVAMAERNEDTFGITARDGKAVLGTCNKWGNSGFESSRFGKTTTK